MSAYRTLALLSAAFLAGSAAMAAAGPPTDRPPATITTAQALSLVQSTLMSIHDANQSGNYTVLKDLGSPAFQKRPANELAKLFGPLRARNLDLFSAASITPNFSGLTLDTPDRLHARGTFPTRPHQVVFDFEFERVDNVWKHSKLSLGLKPAVAQ